MHPPFTLNLPFIMSPGDGESQGCEKMCFFMYRNTHLLHESETSKVKAGTGEDNTG